MPVYFWTNSETGEEVEHTTSISTIDSFLDGRSDRDLWSRIPQLSAVTRASYVEGTKRKGFADLKEANRLQKASYDLPPKERQEVKKEINIIKKATKT